MGVAIRALFAFAMGDDFAPFVSKFPLLHYEIIIGITNLIQFVGLKELFHSGKNLGTEPMVLF